ncbi:MAG: acyltransferase [Deltaproteobacteria bacterium]|nr:acyltransferase [Deltaproteobacteria bacterium]
MIWAIKMADLPKDITLIRNLPGGFGKEIRKRYLKKHFKACGAGLVLHEDLRFRNIQNLSLGDSVRIGPGCFVQAAGGVTIGNNVLLGPRVMICSTNHVYALREMPIMEQGYENRPVSIGDDVWVGANAFILPGRIIGRGCVVAASSVVKGNIQPFSVMAGNPARKVKTRGE